MEAFVFVLSLRKMRVGWMIERGSESCMIDIDLDIDIQKAQIDARYHNRTLSYFQSPSPLSEGSDEHLNCQYFKSRSNQYVYFRIKLPHIIYNLASPSRNTIKYKVPYLPRILMFYSHVQQLQSQAPQFPPQYIPQPQPPTSTNTSAPAHLSSCISDPKTQLNQPFKISELDDLQMSHWMQSLVLGSVLFTQLLPSANIRISDSP